MWLCGPGTPLAAMIVMIVMESIIRSSFAFWQPPDARYEFSTTLPGVLPVSVS